MSRRKRGLWIFPAAGVGLALLALFALRSKQPRVPSEYGLSPGDRLYYEINYRTTSKADFRVLFEGADSAEDKAKPSPSVEAQSYGTFLRGELVMTVLERRPDRLLCSYKVAHSSVKLEIGGKKVPAQAETIAATVGRDVFAEMTPRGRVMGVLIGPQADSMAQGFILALLAKIQFVLPEVSWSGENAWKVEEEDPNGKYLARYETSESFEAGSVKDRSRNLASFRKAKEKYFPAESGGKTLLPRLRAVVQPEGATEFLFDAKGGFLEALNGSETERISVSGKEVARVESRMSLRRLRGETVPTSEYLTLLEAFRSRKAVADFIPLTMTISEEDSELAIQRTALGQATLESLTAELRMLEAEGRRQDTNLYLKFKALVYLHPEACPDLGKLLAGASSVSIARDIVGGALTAVGHPEAQDAIAELIRSRRNEPGFITGLIQALSQVRFPTESAEKTLRDIAVGPADEHVNTAALFGLGSMARNLKEADPERAERLVDGLISLIRPPMTERAMDTILKALGNSGSDKALPVFEEFTKHSSSSLRATAAAGLRFVDSGQADSVLATVLASDAEDSVRTSALFALSFRKPTGETLKAHIQVVSQDESEAVRLAALNNMGNMVGEFPEALAVIRRVAKEDSSENVRNTAANILLRILDTRRQP